MFLTVFRTYSYKIAGLSFEIGNDIYLLIFNALYSILFSYIIVTELCLYTFTGKRTDGIFKEDEKRHRSFEEDRAFQKDSEKVHCNGKQ